MHIIQYVFITGIACEQALCLGKNSEEREGKELFAFPSSHPAGLKACSQASKEKQQQKQAK